MQGVEGGGQGLVLMVHFGEALCAGKVEGDSPGGSYSNLNLESGEERVEVSRRERAWWVVLQS